jgi:hypothetical protein
VLAAGNRQQMWLGWAATCDVCKETLGADDAECSAFCYINSWPTAAFESSCSILAAAACVTESVQEPCQPCSSLSTHLPMRPKPLMATLIFFSARTSTAAAYRTAAETAARVIAVLSAQSVAWAPATGASKPRCHLWQPSIATAAAIINKEHVNALIAASCANAAVQRAARTH